MKTPKRTDYNMEYEVQYFLAFVTKNRNKCITSEMLIFLENEFIRLTKLQDIDLLDSNNVEPQIVETVDALNSISLLIQYSKNNNLDFNVFVEFQKRIERISYDKLVQKNCFFKN